MDARRSLGARILLVDDQPDQVEMYRIALEHAGFIVDEAIDGAAAIAQARSEPPDAIVLDVRLPDIDGWKVCAALKLDPRTTRIPIVILTAIALPSIAEQAAQVGCVAHLLKPCYPDDLIQTVRQVLAAT